VTHAADPLDLPLLEMAHRIQAGTLSPVVLAERALERMERLGPRLNCFVTATPAVALAQARQAEQELRRGHHRGRLHGVPYGLKDNIDTRGIRTTWGARPYADRVPDRDATVVRRLQDGGAVLMGKLSLIELAGGLGFGTAHASVNGACRNPWDPSRWAGGSSSGPAAAVAAGLVAFALGTETIGSLLSPAAHCGVTAFRPTYGVVSRHGVLPFAFTLDRVGPIARTAEDCDVVLGALVGIDPADPATVRAPAGLEHLPRHLSGLRAAVMPLPTYFEVDPSIAERYREALAALRSAGVLLDEQARLPSGPWVETSFAIVEAEAEVAFEDLLRSGRVRELSDPSHRAPGRAYGLEGRPSDYVKAMAIRAELQRAMKDFFERYELVVSANTPIAPPLVDEPLPSVGGDEMRIVGNLLGLPAAGVPMGFIAPGKLPVGLTITGRPMEDARVLAAAALFQSRTRWHLERPPMAQAG
jgi:aspartyl-tRNA(Asn)/glutamyl-tRNA(Gln) amidotransferase subunit A